MTADEVVNVEFCDQLQLTLAENKCDAYWLNYTNHFLQRRLRFGVPQRKLALLRVGAGLYERVEEDNWSNLDMEIHEHPVIDGPIGEIRAPIEHNDYKGIQNFVDRHTQYAVWEARRFTKAAISKLNHRWTWRQRVKYRSLQQWWYPWVYFGYNYVVRLGFLDGAAGFQYSLFKLWYFELIRQDDLGTVVESEYSW